MKTNLMLSNTYIGRGLGKDEERTLGWVGRLLLVGVKFGGRGVQSQVNKSGEVWGSPCDL